MATKDQKLTAALGALVGAVEMLDTIAKGGSYSALEYHARLARYKQVLLEVRPSLKADPYFGKLFEGGA